MTMGTGVVVFVVGLALAIRGRRTITTSRVAADSAGTQNVSERTTRSSDPRDV